jgi:UDP:flavonoid glycosyltransferase YjiC (YdhE family)
VRVLIASTPLMGHLNPLLAIGHTLLSEGHEVLGLSAGVMRDSFERVGAEFRTFPAGADLDLRNRDALFPEWKKLPPGPELLRFALEHVFVDTIQPQHEGLRQVLREFPADVVIRILGQVSGVPSVLRDGHRNRLPMDQSSPGKHGY